MKADKIAVLGGGAGAHAVAADLSLRGYVVFMYHARSSRDFIDVLRTQQIEVSGEIEGTAQIRFTTDLGECLAESDLILVLTPAFAHEQLAELMASKVKEEHIIILMPGNFGSLEFLRIFRQSRSQLPKALGEVSSLPFTARRKRPGQVHIIGRRSDYLFAAALPSTRNVSIVNIFKELYPLCRKKPDVLNVSISNINMVLHPAAVVLNAGRIEFCEREQKDYYLYDQGVSESVGHVLATLDAERLMVARALGYCIPSLKDELKMLTNSSTEESIYKIIHGSDIAKAVGPFGLRHRYLIEDVPYGLVPLSVLGKMVGVATRICDSVINLGSSLNQTDYWKEGRNANRMGIRGMLLRELRNFVKQGE